MSRTAEEQANLDLVLRMFAEVLNPMDSGAVDRFISPGYLQHNHDVKRAFVDGDHGTVHYHVRRWPGDAGWAVMDIFRIEDGLIAEHWDVMQDVVEGGPNPLGPF